MISGVVYTFKIKCFLQLSHKRTTKSYVEKDIYDGAEPNLRPVPKIFTLCVSSNFLMVIHTNSRISQNTKNELFDSYLGNQT